jgi:hypothetical protein
MIKLLIDKELSEQDKQFIFGNINTKNEGDGLKDTILGKRINEVKGERLEVKKDGLGVKRARV